MTRGAKPLGQQSLGARFQRSEHPEKVIDVKLQGLKFPVATGDRKWPSPMCGPDLFGASMI